MPCTFGPPAQILHPPYPTKKNSGYVTLCFFSHSWLKDGPGMKMDFPNKNMGIFQPAMLVYQRVVPRRVLMLRVFFQGSGSGVLAFRISVKQNKQR